MAELPRSACWEAGDASIVLAIEALERSKSVFLATHSPIEGFEILGAPASDVAATTEQTLLDALSAPTTRHAFCVVEGEPGSGKSHLIRWLKVNWPTDEALAPLLIQRSDGSLQGVLQQLQRVLPEEHQHLFDMVGRPQKLTDAGRARVFHANLALALRPDHFASPPEDAKWCDDFKLAELIGDNALLDRWKAPERIIQLLSGKKGKRDQELARFNLEDIAELEQLLQPLKAPTPRAVRFKNELKREAEAIRQTDRQELRSADAQQKYRELFDYSYRLVDALNERHNDAVQNLLGISNDGLRGLFQTLRRDLRNRRLVLLLEDITAWEGVDRQLIDVLVTNAGTREEQDLCPIISVVGITPDYFQNKGFQANYRQRITHHIRLGKRTEKRDYQEVLTLRTAVSQVAFAAKYLRATRAGVKRLNQWNGGPGPVPNRCDSCPHKEPCHAEFGHCDGVGLFPFTTHSITKMFSILRDPDYSATQQTPRGMIQGVLSPTLTNATVLDASEYPGGEIETNLIPKDSRQVFGQMPLALEAKVEDGPTRERMRRLIVYWGSGDPSPRTLADKDGSLLYAGVRQGIYQSFGLPWLGGNKPDESDDLRDPRPPKQTESESNGESPGGGTVRAPEKPGGTGPGPRLVKPLSKAQLLAVQQDIAKWTEGRVPEKAGDLNRLVYDMLDRISWEYCGISPWMRSRVFTTDTVGLVDTKPARSQYLLLGRETWVKRGIEAYQALRTLGEDLEAHQAEDYSRAYSIMRRKLMALASSKVRERLPRLESGEPWDVTASATQVLVVRAWLRGSTYPTAKSWEQWRAVIVDEGDTVSSPQDRVESWNESVNATKGPQGTLRALLRTSIGLPPIQPHPDQEKTGSSVALLNESLVRALRAVGESTMLSPLPGSVEGLGDKLSELTRLYEVASLLSSKLGGIPRFEVDRLIRMAELVSQVSGSSSLREHIKRVDSVVEEIAGHFPNQGTAAVQAWRLAKQKLESQGFLISGADNPGASVERFLDQVSSSHVPDVQNRAEAISWALDAPAAALRSVYTGLQAGEGAMGALLAYVEAFLAGTPGGSGSLEIIHDFGNRLRESVNEAVERCKDVDK